MRIDVLALDGVFDLGLSAILDVFQTANELSVALRLSVPEFRVRIVGMRRTVRTAHGFGVPVTSVAESRADCIVVPALGYKMPATLEPALVRPDVQDAVRFLQQANTGTRMLTAACIGTFVLAETGLLNHQRATTTWWLAAFFHKRYPRVQLEESNMIVPSGHLITAGAALSHVDLALWLVRRTSPQLASMVARYLIVDSRPSQSAYALHDHLVHADPIVMRFEAWAKSRLAEGFSLDAAARAVGASKRTLARHMHHTLGKSPLTYFQELRVQRAVHLLKTGDQSVDAVASSVGYANAGTLRSLLRRHLRIGIRDLRRG